MSSAGQQRRGATDDQQRFRGLSGRELDRRVVLRAAAGVAAIAAAGGIGSSVGPGAIAQGEPERVTRAGEWEPPSSQLGIASVGGEGGWQSFQTDFPFYAIGASWPVDVGAWPVVEVQLSNNGESWSESFLLTADNDGGGGTDANAERHFTPLIHTDGAEFVQFRTLDAEGSAVVVSGLRFTYIDATDGPWEKDIGVGGEAAIQAEDVDTTTPPPIVTREQWGANESYRFASFGEIWPPEYATVEHIIIHHTATPNSQDIPTAVRSIYYYHAVSQGWGDIGYNYLVGRDGRIYQGRYGGQNVIGGHSYQYAVGSSGISIIGDFQSTPVPQAALAGLVSIVAWVGRDLDPYGASDFHETLDLPTICTHRDVNATTCPGDYLYNELPQIRDLVAATLDSGELETPFPGGIVVGDRVMVNTPGESLNLRSGAGTEFGVSGSLAHGAFAIVADGPVETGEGNWLLLDAEEGGLSGWALADYLLVSPLLINTDGFPFGINIYARVSANIRSGPSLGNGTVGATAAGDLGFIMAGPLVADGYDWYQVHWQNGREGWTAGEFIAASPVDENPPAQFAVGDYAIATQYLDIRIRPGLAQTIIASLPAEASLQITKAAVGVNNAVWYGVYTEQDDGGWVVENNLRPRGGPSEAKFEIGDTVRVTESLSLRTGPGTSAGRIAVMPAGTTGTVVAGPETGSGYTWWQIQTGAYGTGWAVQDWLEETDGGTPPPPPTGKFEAGDAVRVTENLNMRSGPSTGSGVITVLPAGTTGTVLEGPQTGSGYTWWRIQTSRGTGWVVEDWLVADGGTTPPPPPPTGKFQNGDVVRVTETLNMRSGASTGNGVIAVLPAGTTGTVVGGPQTGSGYTWWQIQTSYGTGWVVENWIVADGGTTPPPTGKFQIGATVRTTDNLNLRSGPGTSNSVVSLLPTGTTGTVLEGPQTGSGYTWWRIQTSRGTGWAVEDWLVTA